MTQISVLGPIRALDDGEALDLGGPTQKKLLAALVAHEGEAISVPELLEALWGDEPPASAPATIQSYVSRLRSALGKEAIETTSAGYRLSLDNDRVDSQKFLSMAGNLPTEPEDRLEAIEEALSLWRGAPFDDFEHVDFASRRLIETRLDLQQERAELLAREGRTSEAIGTLEKVIASEPFRESAWIALSQTLATTGRQADAIRALDRFREKLSEIGLEPSPEIEAAEAELFEPDVGAADDEDLPSPATGFFGRLDEVERLGALVEAERLVTVVGPGGMGKTRLALETSKKVEPPKWLVRLEGVREDSKVSAAVLSRLGVEARGEPITGVVEALRRNPGLLILDNCEHVIDSVAKLAHAVVRDSSASILATSREPLGTPGENLLDLGPLDPESAAALYLDRAKKVNPAFSADADQVAELCSQLDFMPLAIEIAASRSRALGPAEILERLDRRYGLLERPRRGEEERHQTLDAMVDWSYSLLPQSSRRVFERVSVFNGEFDLEAATQVAGFGDIDPDEVAAHIVELVERSMLEPASEAGLYRMLRTFKSFARERLGEHGEDRREAHDRHAGWHVSLARDIGVGLVGPEEVYWIERANGAVEDLGAGLQWLVGTGDLDSAGYLLAGLFQWLYHRQPPAIMDWGDRVLAEASGHPAYSMAGAWAATAALKRGEVDEATRIAEAATEYEFGDSALAWFIAGDVACYIGDAERSVVFYEETLKRARSKGDDVAIVDALSRLMLSLVRNRALFDEAMARKDELVDRIDRVDAPSSRSHAEFALGSALVGSDVEVSRETLQRALERARSIGNQYIEGMALSELGSVLASEDRLDEAQQTLFDAIDVFHQLGDHPHEWSTLRYLAVVFAKSGSPEVAAKLVAAADASGFHALSSQTALWEDVFEELAGHPEYERWAEEGARLALEEATQLAEQART